MLRTLTFISCCGLEYFNISAPQVKEITVRYSHEVNPIFFNKFPNLTIIDIYLGKKSKAFYQGKGPPIRFSELHEKCPRIETFRCDGYFLTLSASAQMRPFFRFQFLTSLWFNGLSFEDFNQMRSVIWLLNSAPSLRKLTAWISSKKGTVVQSALAHSELPGCMGKLLNLQSVELNRIEGSAHELLFIQCILAFTKP